ncbi:hypothetical protein VNO77_18897 [Canavalia gladiata]|uniref:Uncharacterized protein n=1 Tax=Canavalia gladiata TaxID=3824 RepID=A0AAN9LLM6_CANGL
MEGPDAGMCCFGQFTQNLVLSYNTGLRPPYPGSWWASLDAAVTEPGVRLQRPRNNIQYKIVVLYPAPNDLGNNSNQINRVEELNLKVATTLNPVLCPAVWYRVHPC